MNEPKRVTTYVAAEDAARTGTTQVTSASKAGRLARYLRAVAGVYRGVEANARAEAKRSIKIARRQAQRELRQQQEAARLEAVKKACAQLPTVAGATNG